VITAAAMTSKNSELSDVSKPLSGKEKSKPKEQENPLEGIDLSNTAGQLNQHHSLSVCVAQIASPVW